jgi:hypothetical protein
VNEPSADLRELRALVATEHGLPPKAATFLTGTTLVELYASATKLARLIEERTDPGPFTDMAAARARRKAQLASIFAGGTPQPRDDAGRYARPAEFHRGAREPAPQPPESHDRWLVRALRSRAADRGAQF